MEKRSKIFIAVTVLLLLIAASGAFPITHVIQFGGAVGLAYSPNNLTCSVGDTIKWEGAFSSHPLSSTTIPAGAATWHSASGSVFAYVVTVAGIYHYQCDFHVGSGMFGQFSANPSTGVEEQTGTQKPESFELGQNYPNPFNPATTISYRIPSRQRVTLKLFDVLGHEVEILVDETQNAGNYVIRLDGSKLESGVYFYRLQTEQFEAVKRLTLIK
jgi:plastocyanin